MFHEESKRLRKDVTCELDPPCIYESQEDLCVFLFPGTLGKSCSEQFLKNCTAADNLPLKIVPALRQHTRCSAAAHTLLCGSTHAALEWF